MLQVITFVPSARAVTVLDGALGGLKIPAPSGEIDQLPVVVPVVLLADKASVGVLKQSVGVRRPLITAGLGGG